MKKLSVLLLMISIAVISTWVTAQEDEIEYLTYVQVGDKVPVDQFVDIDGMPIDLADSQNNKLLVLFATWCPDSQRAVNALVASKMGQDYLLDVIGVGREETPESLRQFANEHQVKFPLVADVDRSIYAQFANVGVPRLILLDANNYIVKTIIAEHENPLSGVTWPDSSL